MLLNNRYQPTALPSLRFVRAAAEAQRWANSEIRE